MISPLKHEEPADEDGRRCMVLVASSAAFGAGGGAPRGTAAAIAGKAYKFETVAEGVYYATATGAMVTGSNNVVDRRRPRRARRRHRHAPAAARAFIEDVKLVTNKPIRTSSTRTFTTTTRTATRSMPARPTSSRTTT